MSVKMPKVYISFDIANDEKLKDSLVEQAENPDSPIEITDWSDKDIYGGPHCRDIFFKK